MTAEDVPAEPADAAEAAELTTRPKPPAWVLPTALIPIVAVLIAGWIAGASFSHLIDPKDGHPLLLIALSPINRFLLLARPRLDFLPYFAVGLARHLFPDPFFFMLGHFYGARALKWAAEGSPMAQRLVGADGHGLENPAHRKILYPLAFFIPNNYVSLLAGAARIPVRTFAALNISGTIARLLLCWWIGGVFSSQLIDIANWIGRNQKWITIISVVLVILAMIAQLRPGGQIRKLARLNEDDSTGD